MKRILAFMLSIIITLSLAGCGASDESTGDSSAGSPAVSASGEEPSSSADAEIISDALFSGGIIFENEYIELSFLKTESSQNYEGSGENYFEMVFEVKNKSDMLISLHAGEIVLNNTYVNGVGGRALEGNEENQMKVFSRGFTLNDGANEVDSIRFNLEVTDNVWIDEQGRYSSSLNRDEQLFVQPLMITVAGESLDPEAHPIMPADIELEFDPLRAGSPVDSGSCGENVIWTLYEDGTMVISGTGDMEPQLWRIFETWDDCAEYEDQVINLIIEDGVTSIANGAFSFFTSLKNIKIPSSIDTIGAGALNSCRNKNFMSINIPEGVATIGQSAFFDCEGLINIDIPSSVTSIGDSAFEKCDSLRSINIPDGIDSIGWGMFVDCSDLESIGIPASVTSIGDLAFLGCNSLTDVYFGGSEAEWNAIYIDRTSEGLLEGMGYSIEDNRCLERATIHYNSSMP